MTLIVLLAALPRQASWWELAPALVLGTAAIVVGLRGSRRTR